MRHLPVIIALAIWCPACSPLARVSRNANDIQAQAQLLIDRGRATNDDEVVRGATRIHDLAADIHAQIPALEDKTPAWLSMLWWAAIAASIVGVAFILWQTGIGTAIRVAIGWIPRKKMQEADLAVAMLDPDKPENAREFVAARRASDREFNLAYERAKRQERDGK